MEGEMPGLADLIDRTTLPIQHYDVYSGIAQYLEEYGAGIGIEELLALLLHLERIFGPVPAPAHPLS
jgi:hypothetical protein